MGRILALDIGSKRIGVAVSDPLGWTAQGIAVLQRLAGAAGELEKILKNYEVELLLVGYPLNMDGSEGPQAISVKNYVEELKAEIPSLPPLVFYDERLTSREAEEILKQRGLSPQERRPLVDQLAAELILQSYLRDKGI